MKRITGLLAACLLALNIAQPAHAAEPSFHNESIYDLLVDRFNNGLGSNDFDVDTQDLNAFNGGDFAGIVNRLQHIIDMQFTTVSIGPVFKTATYDGKQVLDYGQIEPHFGTDEELKELIGEMHEHKLKLITDFPLGGVSADHVLANELKTIPAADGTIDWDLKDKLTQNKIMDAAVQFIKSHDVDGIRLTNIGQADDAYLNAFIEKLKDEKEHLYVITNEQSTANFDSEPATGLDEALKKAYVEVNPDSSSLDEFTKDDEGRLLQFDELTGPRFTYDMVELRQFPPTRWKVAATSLFMLPGVPVVTYATEIAVNGKEAPDTHPLMNFKTEMELKDFIGDLNNLRNSSDTLRNGDFKMLTNTDGFTVFTRSSDDETWFVAINNTSEVQGYTIDHDLIGNKKKLRGVLGQDLVKESNGEYHIVLERELAEVYIVEEDKGFNTPYLIASILVYVFFIAFLIAVIRKGRQRRKDGANT